MTFRIMVALLVVVPTVMAYPWPTAADRWLAGIALAVVVVLFARWRGLFVTTVVARRLGLWGRRHPGGAPADPTSVTELLRIDGDRSDQLPMRLIAGYVDRYGIRCRKVRVTSRDRAGVRTTWISLTLAAADNLPALIARSPRIPLRDTAEVHARRLAEHLRERGWDVTAVDCADTPVEPASRQTWRGLRTGSDYLAAYDLVEVGTLPRVRGLDALEIWWAVEITGTTGRYRAAAACAVRTSERPGAAAPIPGLRAQHGRHGPALQALDPASTGCLHARAVPVDAGVLTRT